MQKRLNNFSLGFTLIELLLVIAILGILSVVIFVLLNPGERQAQARDAGRISAVVQLGHAVEGYYSSRKGIYPDIDGWGDDLIETGEVSSFPSGIEYVLLDSTDVCGTSIQPGDNPTYCYDLSSEYGAIVFARAEAGNANDRCVFPERAYFVYSTADGRGGTICSEGDPSPWAPGTMDYAN